MEQRFTYHVVFESDESGGFAVTCPAIDGCISQGNTIDEATENIRDAIQLSIEDLRARGEQLPQPADLRTGSVEVTVRI